MRKAEKPYRVVYGGAFNPPTKAHLEVYRYLLERVDVGCFVYLPVSSRYRKGDLASDTHRLRMLKLATTGLEKATVSDLELQDDAYYGTYESLRRLDTPDQRTAFVLGADHLRTLPRWKQAEKLLSSFTFFVLNREGKDLEALIAADAFLYRHREAFKLFDDFKMEISSSMFRRRLDWELVPEAVAEYIKEHNLYGA